MASESETVRAEFERAMQTRGEPQHKLRRDSFGEYVEDDIGCAWIGFQAARSSTPSAETLDRRELQREGKHPAPCARHCESTAYEIEIRRLKAALAGRAPSAEAKDAWLPIETAPRATTASIYPTYFLMYGVGGYFEDFGSVEKGYREQDGEVCFVNGLPAPEATHWRKMLDGPAIAQQPKEDDRGPSR